MEKIRKVKTDIILIAALLVAGGIIAAVILLGGRGSGVVSIRVDGQQIAELPLDADTEYTINGVGGVNILTIENGRARISEADCPDGLCKNMGNISRAGQSIICLPHRVVVEIISKEDQAGPDIDVYVE